MICDNDHDLSHGNASPYRRIARGRQKSAVWMSGYVDEWIRLIGRRTRRKIVGGVITYSYHSDSPSTLYTQFSRQGHFCGPIIQRNTLQPKTNRKTKRALLASGTLPVVSERGHGWACATLCAVLRMNGYVRIFTSYVFPLLIRADV